MCSNPACSFLELLPGIFRLIINISMKVGRGKKKKERKATTLFLFKENKKVVQAKMETKLVCS